MQKPIDPDDPDFKGKPWAEIEEELDRREREDLEEQGIVLPLSKWNMQEMGLEEDGREKKTGGGKVVFTPWDTKVEWAKDYKPKCTSKNWSHKDVKLKIDASKSIAYVTLNAPDRNNSLNDDVQNAMQDAIMELQTRKDIRVVVLNAEGRMFCAGGDPKWFQASAKLSDAENEKSALQLAKILHFFQTLPQLTIGCIQGSAMGGGVGFTAMCDVVLAVKSAFFVLSEVKLGVIPATISPYVVAKIGTVNSKRLFCTAENCNATAAKAMGLVTEVVADEAEMKTKLEEYCKAVTMCAPEAVAMSKNLCNSIANQPVTNELIEYLSNEGAKVAKGKEAKEAMTGLAQKRKPEWAGKAVSP